jgi:hypothetical protein
MAKISGTLIPGLFYACFISLNIHDTEQKQ